MHALFGHIMLQYVREPQDRQYTLWSINIDYCTVWSCCNRGGTQKNGLNTLAKHYLATAPVMLYRAL